MIYTWYIQWYIHGIYTRYSKTTSWAPLNDKWQHTPHIISTCYKYNTWQTLPAIHHTRHISCHTSHQTHFLPYITPDTLPTIHHTRHITCHKSHQTHYTLHVACHKPHQTFLHKWLSNMSQFYGTWRFLNTFTTAHYLYLSSARSIQSTPPNPTSSRSILLVSSHLYLGHPNGCLPSAIPTKTMYAPFWSPTHATYPTHHISLDFITLIIFGDEYRPLSS
jgi:hypothetical protein